MNATTTTTSSSTPRPTAWEHFTDALTVAGIFGVFFFFCSL